MRFGADDKFWVVTDPRPESTLGDILFQASLRDLERQFKGGLTMDDHPTLLTDRREAEVEAHARIIAVQVSRVLANVDPKDLLSRAVSIELLDAEGCPVFEADIPLLAR
ncbi:MAG: hypothetical protein KAY32_14880 [Candidatus Eisenbacteria sp.]|nr:hypothetical protein [Candidatus Eisenbacteria bacterium]